MQGVTALSAGSDTLVALFKSATGDPVVPSAAKIALNPARLSAPVPSAVSVYTFAALFHFSLSNVRATGAPLLVRVT